MADLTEIIARLDADHPEITRLENGTVIVVSGSDREAMLREWAQGMIDGAFERMRNERNTLLASSDWAGLADSPLTEAKRKAWAKYRQALRDLPESVDDPTVEVAWPEPPK